MKILHTIPSLGPARGGPTEAALNMCRGLAARGFDVTLVATDDNGMARLNVPLMQPLQQDGITLLYFARTFREYTIAPTVARWLSQHIADYDLVHIHALFSYVPTITALIARRARVPYSITAHGILLPWGIAARRTGLKQLSMQFIERPMLNNAQFVHATTSHEASALTALGVTAPIEAIPLGVTPPPTDPPVSPKQGNELVILFMGRLHPVKGLDLLLPAFAQALQTMPHLSLMIAGNGDPAFTASLHRKADRLGIADHVNWLGFVEGASKWQALAQSDLVVAPSYSESFGMSVAEAMMAGKPVITSTGVALHHDVVQAGAGLVVPCEVQPLADAVLKLASNPSLRSTMGQQGLALTQQKFALLAVTDKLLHLYRKTLQL